jgi:hypothetical protein
MFFGILHCIFMECVMTPEDEAFDELARRQGMWDGGFQAKRQAAMDKINSHFDAAYKKMHEDRVMYGTSWSKNGERIDPASVYLDEPAQEPYDQTALELCGVCGWKTLIPDECCLNCERAQPAQEPPSEWAGIKAVLDEYGLQAIDFVANFKAALAQPVQEPEMLTIVYQSGYHDGKQAALAGREWNFCERCGKRTKDLTVIHTCTPPQEGA